MGVSLFPGYRNLDNDRVNMARNIARNKPPKHTPETKPETYPQKSSQVHTNFVLHIISHHLIVRFRFKMATSSTHVFLWEQEVLVSHGLVTQHMLSPEYGLY